MVIHNEQSEWLISQPEITSREAASIAREVFGVDGEAFELGSQQDRNFAIRTKTWRTNADSMLLKIDNSATTVEELGLQRAVSERLLLNGVRTPRPLDTQSEKPFHALISANGVRGRCRGFELVNGQSLKNMAMNCSFAELLGRLAGETVNALQDLAHPASARSHQWGLRQAPAVVNTLKGFLSEERREQCVDAVRRASEILAGFPNLPTQIIHGDITADNVLIDDSRDFWLVDIGDASESWRVAELAITMADILGQTGSLTMAGRALSGYSEVAEITEEEIAAIWPLIVHRGGVLSVSGESQVSIDPSNSYALQRVEHEWNVFRQAVAIDFKLAEAHLRLVAGFPHRKNVDYYPLVDPSLRLHEVDLGVLNHSIEPSSEDESQIIRATVSSETVAVARFGEPRIARIPLSTVKVAAVRSRCVEFWCFAGTTVYAPFAGDLRVTERGIELEDLGVILEFRGLESVGESRRIRAGDPLGSVIGCEVKADDELEIGKLVISRRISGRATDKNFAQWNEEFETDGAADPSFIIGVASLENPEVRLQLEQARRLTAIGGASERYYENPPRIERGTGVWLIDTRGRALLDMVNNVASVGHSHPRLSEAITHQLKLLNTNSRFLYSAYADFTEKLLEHSPDPSLDTVIPVNSGSEALDLAIRLAQIATRRKGIVAVREGYHGWTMAADSVSTSAFDNPNALLTRPNWVHLVDAPNPYRGVHTGSDSGQRYAADVRDMISELSNRGEPPAAFLAEPVHGNAGGVVPPEGYLPEVYQAIRDFGGLAIADEVQVGYGRLGAAFWGSAMLGAIPDIIAVAKAAGSGYPLGAVITKRSIVDSLREEGMFFSSAGGSPVSSVAGATVLDIIRDEQLQQNASVVGNYLLGRLQRLQQRHQIIGAVHGQGLYLGVELVQDRQSREPAVRETAWVCERLLEHGVIMQATSERQNVLKVKPPLVISVAEAEMFVEALDQALKELAESEE